MFQVAHPCCELAHPTTLVVETTHFSGQPLSMCDLYVT